MSVYYNKVSQSFIRKIEDIVGEENVHTEPAILICYTRDAGITAESRMPEAVICPDSTQEISEIMKISYKERIPVTVLSSGKDVGAASFLPLYGGILLDLKRMDRIIEVNEKYRYVVVEPGVTFHKLYREMRQKGFNWRFAVPAAPPAVCVISNYIGAGGAGFTTHTNHFTLARGMEIVLPNGDIINTWSPKVPFGVSWGFGPSIDGLFLQGNFGIITKMGVRPLGDWERFDWLIYGADKLEDIISFMEFSLNLYQHGIIRGCYTLYNWLSIISSTETYPWEVTGGKASLPDETRQKLMDKHGIGWWLLVVGFCGSKGNVEGRMSYTEKEAKNYPKLYPMDKKETLKIPEVDDKLKAMQGIPTRAESNWMSWRSGGLVWYSSQPILSGEEALTLTKNYEEIHAKHGFDYSTKYILPPIQSNFLLFKQPNERQRAKQAYMEIIEKTLDAGYTIRRYDVCAEPLILSRNGSLRDALTNIKNGLDPYRILNPAAHAW
jgi:4-cresol dehydrogenase (hydroxylating)